MPLVFSLTTATVDRYEIFLGDLGVIDLRPFVLHRLSIALGRGRRDVVYSPAYVLQRIVRYQIG